MTQDKYEKIRKETWLDIANYCGFSDHDVTKISAFNSAFDYAYKLGRQEIKEKETVIDGWVARNGSGPNDLGLHVYTVKPDRMKNRREWNGHGEMSYLIDCRLFTDLIWETEPQEVELIIKRKNK